MRFSGSVGRRDKRVLLLEAASGLARFLGTSRQYADGWRARNANISVTLKRIGLGIFVWRDQTISQKVFFFPLCDKDRYSRGLLPSFLVWKIRAHRACLAEYTRFRMHLRYVIARAVLITFVCNARFLARRRRAR